MKKYSLPPSGMDAECIELCEAMNLLPGIQTIESCCGHGTDNYRIWFQAAGLKYLPRLIYWFSPCHSGIYHWQVIAHTDCGMSPVTFMLEGTIGEQAYAESKELARLIREEVENE